MSEPLLRPASGQLGHRAHKPCGSHDNHSSHRLRSIRWRIVRRAGARTQPQQADQRRQAPQSQARGRAVSIQSGVTGRKVVRRCGRVASHQRSLDRRTATAHLRASRSRRELLRRSLGAVRSGERRGPRWIYSSSSSSPNSTPTASSTASNGSARTVSPDAAVRTIK
jgi:hypothetical protein